MRKLLRNAYDVEVSKLDCLCKKKNAMREFCAHNLAFGDLAWRACCEALGPASHLNY